MRVAQAELHGQDLAGMLEEMLQALESKSLRLTKDCSLSSPDLKRLFEAQGVRTRDDISEFNGTADMSWKRVRFREKWASLAYALDAGGDLVLELRTLIQCDKPVVTSKALSAVAAVCQAARPDYGDGSPSTLWIRPLVVLEVRQL